MYAKNLLFALFVCCLTVHSAHSFMADPSRGDRLETVYTPRGSAVSVWRPGWNFDPYTIASTDKWITDSYPFAFKLSPTSRNYNCHTHAWYLTGTGIKVWMDDPTKYMTDGSYRKLDTQDLIAHNPPMPDGAIVHYNNGTHSAIKRGINFESKWGDYPLMLHAPLDSPYSPTGCTLYPWPGCSTVVTYYAP